MGAHTAHAQENATQRTDTTTHLHVHRGVLRLKQQNKHKQTRERERRERRKRDTDVRQVGRLSVVLLDEEAEGENGGRLLQEVGHDAQR